MGTIKMSGIIISENNLGDYDKMLTMLTPGVGKISCVAKGARRQRSALLAGTQFLCFGEYLMYKGANTYNINSCETIEVFYKLRTDLDKLNYAVEITKIVKDVTEEEIRKIYEDAYKDEQFVRFLNAGVCPETRWVEGSNYVDVNVKVDERTHRVIMMGAMDNLVKGAAGQAVQNMNLIFGLPETEGLLMPPVFP